MKIRAETSEIWWRQWYLFKKSLGTEDEVYDELEQQLRANPKNFDLLEKYLRVVPKEYKNRIWLLDVVPNDMAYESYELAVYFNPEIAIELYKKSLSLPFTETDIKLFNERAFRNSDFRVENPEKQTRFWSKRNLAKLYQETGQSDLAQPLVEELSKMDKSGILDGDVSKLAGMVQASTGRRVVEKQILNSEKEKQSSYQYWLERAEYYKGRKEKKIVWQTYLKGLSKFNYDPSDRKKVFSRYYILRGLAEFGESYDKPATEKILKVEISKANSAKDGIYVLELLNIVENDFEDLFQSSFVNTDLLPMALSNISVWGNQESLSIESVLNKDWDANKRAVIIEKLFALAMENVKSRAFYFAEVLEDVNPQMAVLLLESLLIVVSRDYKETDFLSPQDIKDELFDVYINSGNWRKAEKMYFSDFNKSGNWHKEYYSQVNRETELMRLAVAAAQAGAIEDAVRLWKLNANFDRRKLKGLSELAKTSAKPYLQTFYLEMKRKDSLTDIPDKALEILK